MRVTCSNTCYQKTISKLSAESVTKRSDTHLVSFVKIRATQLYDPLLVSEFQLSTKMQNSTAGQA